MRVTDHLATGYKISYTGKSQCLSGGLRNDIPGIYGTQVTRQSLPPAVVPRGRNHTRPLTRFRGWINTSPDKRDPFAASGGDGDIFHPKPTFTAEISTCPTRRAKGTFFASNPARGYHQSAVVQ